MTISHKIKLNRIGKIELLAVLGHSNVSSKIEDPMTFDAEVRIRAAGVLYKNKEVSRIALLGGGNDRVMKVAEGERMRKYLEENFHVPENVMEVEAEGTNTITDIAFLIIKVKRERIDQKKVAFLTSGYNVVRVKLVLEILGWPDALVLSSERILMGANDKMTQAAGDYLESEEYQKRLSYESYWIARTVYDEKYTEEVRKQLGIERTPVRYFESEPRREMDNIDK